MNASIPGDYYVQQADILLTENRMQHERISALESQVKELRKALDAIIRRVALVSPYYEMARAALAATEEK